MNWSFEWLLGWRYTSVSRGAHKNRFISFISILSMIGIILGVAALITPLAVHRQVIRQEAPIMIGGALGRR